MREIKNCLLKKNIKYNTFANNLYGPEKILLTEFCKHKKYNRYQKICCNYLLNNYQSYTEFDNNNFIVVKYNDNKNLYILNKCEQEIDKIILKLPNNTYYDNILGIAYNCLTGKIYIAQKRKVFSVDKNGNFIKDEINNETLQKIVSNNCLCEKELNYNICCKKNIIIKKPCISSIGISENNMLVTYDINGSTYISKLTTNGNLVNEEYIDDNIIPYKILDLPCGIYILSKKDCTYDYIYIFNKTKGLCEYDHNYCEIILDEECRIDIECPDIYCDLETCICDVIKSIAIIEKALAKLINNESEKIKNAIEKSKSNKEILEINNSVSKTIMNITYLEQMLKEKLEVALCMYECKKK